MAAVPLLNTAMSEALDPLSRLGAVLVNERI
jgi:hypothetical protein